MVPLSAEHLKSMAVEAVVLALRMERLATTPALDLMVVAVALHRLLLHLLQKPILVLVAVVVRFTTMEVGPIALALTASSSSATESPDAPY